jgi:hypothetical protein
MERKVNWLGAKHAWKACRIRKGIWIDTNSFRQFKKEKQNLCSYNHFKYRGGPMIECSCERLLEESELITEIVINICNDESLKCIDAYVSEFRDDLIQAFSSHLKEDDFAEVDKLVRAYSNYKDFVAKRKNIET